MLFLWHHSEEKHSKNPLASGIGLVQFRWMKRKKRREKCGPTLSPVLSCELCSETWPIGSCEQEVKDVKKWAGLVGSCLSVWLRLGYESFHFTPRAWDLVLGRVMKGHCCSDAQYASEMTRKELEWWRSWTGVGRGGWRPQGGYRSWSVHRDGGIGTRVWTQVDQVSGNGIEKGSRVLALIAIKGDMEGQVCFLLRETPI